MPNSIMKKTCASDYIAIKKQNAIFNGENKNNMVINAIEKCCLKNPQEPICKVRTSKSYEIKNDFYNGRRYNKEICEL
jgi:hypothetical protein